MEIGIGDSEIYRWVNIRRIIIFDTFSILQSALLSLVIFMLPNLIGFHHQILDFSVISLCSWLIMMRTEDRKFKDLFPFPLIFQIIRGSLLFCALFGCQYILTSHYLPYYEKNPKVRQAVQEFPPLQWILYQIHNFIVQIDNMIRTKIMMIFVCCFCYHTLWIVLLITDN